MYRAIETGKLSVIQELAEEGLLWDLAKAPRPPDPGMEKAQQDDRCAMEVAVDFMKVNLDTGVEIARMLAMEGAKASNTDTWGERTAEAFSFLATFGKPADPQTVNRICAACIAPMQAQLKAATMLPPVEVDGTVLQAANSRWHGLFSQESGADYVALARQLAATQEMAKKLEQDRAQQLPAATARHDSLINAHLHLGKSILTLMSAMHDAYLKQGEQRQSPAISQNPYCSFSRPALKKTPLPTGAPKAPDVSKLPEAASTPTLPAHPAQPDLGNPAAGIFPFAVPASVSYDEFGRLSPGEHAFLTRMKPSVETLRSYLQAYRGTGVPLVPATFPTVMPLTSPQYLAKGGCNSVFWADCRVLATGMTLRYVLKSECDSNELTVAESNAGITEANARHGLNNLATYEVAKGLGWNIVPHTSFCVYRVQQPDGSYAGELFLAMEYVKAGSPPAKVKEWFTRIPPGTRLHERVSQLRPTLQRHPGQLDNLCKTLGCHAITYTANGISISVSEPNPKVDFNHRAIIKKFNQLAFLHRLTGALDTHEGNILVTPGDGKQGPGVFSIDNDASFPPKIRTLEQLKRAQGEFQFFSVGLPRETTRDISQDLQKFSIGPAVSSLLTPDQLFSFRARLADTLVELANMERENRIVDSVEAFSSRSGYLERAQRQLGSEHKRQLLGIPVSQPSLPLLPPTP
ncbi:hypothetical protein [Noviherbaspirillum galbum]|uniref:Uncharacterized protein n=1 Tax=Noviherbaspirillum galbum TaxID=2709383 RepID=A0A6B3SJN5_9BURK|nr:hypothetical protein [Noviherbaspirillum galbum]NEX61021.1 hypothetical protein [Noviherbaspirillum galbum]